MKTYKKARPLRNYSKVWRWDSKGKKYELTPIKEVCKCGECVWCKDKLNIFYMVIEGEKNE